MLTVNNMTPERRAKLLELSIESLDELIEKAADLAGAMIYLQQASEAGALPFDETIAETCKDLFSRVSELMLQQRAKLEHAQLMDDTFRNASEEAEDIISKARLCGALAS